MKVVHTIEDLRDQLRGHANNPDEPFIPVTWTLDSSIDGYYTVNSISVEPTQASYKNFTFPWSATLTRLPGGYAQPSLELISVGALRTNTSGIVATNTYDATTWAFTAGGVVPGFTGPSAYTGIENRNNEDVAGSTVQFFASGTSPAASLLGPFLIAPSKSYTAGCRFQQSRDSGEKWRTIQGQQVRKETTYWRISNGLVRVSNVTNTNTGDFGFQAWNGSSWSTTKTLQASVNGFSSLGSSYGTADIRILRNSPLEVIIRVTYNFPTGSGFAVDISMRRGFPWVSLVISAGPYANNGIQLQTVEAATAITGGIRATANDGSGHRYVMACPLAYTSDLANGRLSVAASTSVTPFMFGYEIGGSGSGGDLTAQQQIYQYMAARSHTVRAVSR